MEKPQKRLRYFSNLQTTPFWPILRATDNPPAACCGFKGRKGVTSQAAFACFGGPNEDDRLPRRLQSLLPHVERKAAVQVAKSIGAGDRGSRSRKSDHQALVFYRARFRAS